MPLLSIRNLSVRLGDFSLEKVSFDVTEGSYCCLLGASGAGKSVLLETVIGAFPPQEGRIFLRERDVTVLPPEQRHLGIVYQDYMLFPHLKVYKNIAFGLQREKLSRNQIRERVESMARQLHIHHLLDRDVQTLSGGEQQRTALARALVTNPEILLLDEAFSALDVATRESMRRMLKDLVRDLGITVLHVTHDMEDVWALATHVAVIHEGKLLQEGTPEDVFRRPRPGYVANLVGARNLFTLSSVPSSSELGKFEMEDLFLYSTRRVPPGTKATLSVRPEDIIVARDRIAASSMNQIPLRIEKTEERGPLVWITGRTEKNSLRLQALVTRSGFESLKIVPGNSCVFLFKASSLEVLERDFSEISGGAQVVRKEKSPEPRSA